MQTSGGCALYLHPPHWSLNGAPAAPAPPLSSAPAAPAPPDADAPAPPSPAGGQLCTSQLQPPVSRRKHRPVGPPTLPSAHIVLAIPSAGPHSALAQVTSLAVPAL